MTNVLAVNAVVPKKIDTQYFLRATKQGFPINNQIPRTYQVYTGTGNQTITCDGSNEIRIFGQTLVGPLIINFGPQRRLRDMVGRLVTLNIIGPISQTITLNTSPAFMKINGTALQQLSHVIPGDNISKSITLYFHSEQFINLDYGAAASVSLLTSTAVKTANLSSTYVYGTDTVFNLPAVYIPDSQSYGMFLNDLEPTTDGIVNAFTGSLTGPGTQFVPFEYRPSPRHNKTTTISGYLDDGGNAEAAFTLSVSPILSNVFDREYFIASNTDGSVSMYDPLVDFGGVPETNDANGSQVTLPVNTGPIAVDLADSLIFYVETTSDTVIKWKSYTTYKEGTLLRVSDLSAGVWNIGDRIVDIAFNDKDSSLMVLPNNPTTGKILSIPIKPYKNSDPNTVYTGVLLGATFSLGAGTVLYSIAVCPITREIYVACKPVPFTNSIYKLKPFPDLNSTFSHQDPAINTGRTAICFSSQGTLFILYESTLNLYRVNNGYELSTVPAATSILYTLSQFHRSLSPNCYGWTQA
jgi:hypothetical protein